MMTPPWSLVCLAVTITAVSRQYSSEVRDNEKRNDFSRDIMHFGKRPAGAYNQHVVDFGGSYPAFEREMMSFGKRSNGFEREMMSFGKRSDGFDREMMSFGKRAPVKRGTLPFEARHLSDFDRDMLSFGKRHEFERSMMAFGRRRK